MPRRRLLLLGIAAGTVVVVAGVVLAAALGRGDGGSPETRGAEETTEQTNTTTVGTRTNTGTAARPPTVTTVRVVVRDGRVVRGPKLQNVYAGFPIRLVVRADVRDELHVRGYGHTRPVAPGRTTVLEFRTVRPGLFVVELSRTRLRLLRLFVR